VARLSRPGVRVVNRSIYPTQLVTQLVEGEMRGSKRHPPTVVVTMRADNANTLGFTPFDRSQPIDIYLGHHYPQAGARTWEEELRLSAAHEDWHFRHPHDPCPDGRCERQAEGYAHLLVKEQGHYRRTHRHARRRGTGVQLL
jgi:hypothetical protein